MKKYIQGGVETIITIVIVVGLVILGIVFAILPILDETENTSDVARGGIHDLGEAMGYDPVEDND